MKTTAITMTLAAALATSACASYGDDTSYNDDTTYAASSTMDNDMSADARAVGVNIVQTIVDSPNHTTLEQLVTAAGLADTLRGDGPFTVFAPTDNAFSQVPQQTRTALMQPSNREMLQGVLAYHAVQGRVSADDLANRIRTGGGSATLTTVQGTQLTATMEGDYVKLTDATGGSAYVENADIMNSNGIVHSINGVLMPRS
ncbi:MAG: fasciclin domain-containing protein [Erythrobacter sp.]|uniref:fasciclin domain-containing protein n=1 Tax=Erythrobacter sp. TaxID=1042 RepID=UPI003C713171